jgi:hypothetical protein
MTPMPFSEADQRTVLLHLETIRSIIRGVKPDPIAESDNPLGAALANLPVRGEPDTDGGAARQAAETARRQAALQIEAAYQQKWNGWTR